LVLSALGEKELKLFLEFNIETFIVLTGRSLIENGNVHLVSSPKSSDDVSNGHFKNVRTMYVQKYGSIKKIGSFEQQLTLNCWQF